MCVLIRVYIFLNIDASRVVMLFVVYMSPKNNVNILFQSHFNIN